MFISRKYLNCSSKTSLLRSSDLQTCFRSIEFFSVSWSQSYGTVLYSCTAHQCRAGCRGKGAMPPPSPGPPCPPHRHAHAQSTNSHAVPLRTHVPGEGGHAPPFPRTPIPSSPTRTHTVHKLTRGTRVGPGGGLPPTPSTAQNHVLRKIGSINFSIILQAAANIIRAAVTKF